MQKVDSVIRHIVLAVGLLAVLSFLPAVTALAQSPAEDATQPVNGEMVSPESAEADAIIEAEIDPEVRPRTSRILEGLRLRELVAMDDRESAVLGSLDPASGFRIEAEINPFGAGVSRVSLTDHFTAIDRRTNYTVQQTVAVMRGPDEFGDWGFPMGARTLVLIEDEIETAVVVLDNLPWRREGEVQRTESTHSVTYSAIIENERGQAIIKISREIMLRAGAHHLEFFQTFENRGVPIRFRFVQHGYGDVPIEPSYLGEKRELAAGFFDSDRDPARRHVTSGGTWLARATFLSRREEQLGAQEAGGARSLTGAPFWPGRGTGAPNQVLIWAAATNRYFAAAVFLPIREGESERARAVVPLDERFVLGFDVLRSPIPGPQQHGILSVLRSHPITLEQGEQTTLDVGYYAGPRKHAVFTERPYSVLGFYELLHYDLGGPCSFCTFQWLAHGLIWFLRTIYSVVFDWGIAIIVLVLTVRLILHPLTKKSQISMTKMSKQMQALQPEIKKLKEKFKDDPKQLQQEQMKLFREKGVNPLNMLGCLPLFLQMPIWLALFSMLFFAIELRHQPAFFGVFQLLGNWAFLADLSSPDSFIHFRKGETFRIPILGFRLAYAINILPILMAVFFFYQQKLMTPPAMTPEQAQQQKIMRVMMLFFPVFLWLAPAGLNLYILASSIGGTIDSLIVRRTVKRMEEEGTLFAKKERKEGGFLDRMSKAVEAQKQELEKRQAGAMPDKRGGKGGRRKR